MNIKHPMDDFPVRPLRFALDADGEQQAVWSRTCPEFSVFMNALAMHVPHFERYLVQAMRAAREQITDEALRRDMTAIIGQEANHAHNFLRFNEILVRRYPDVAKIDRASIDWFAHHAKTDSLKLRLGFSAGYETFTFLAGVIVLRNHARWFADADPVMKALWVWHQVEEIEHGAVAFDVYKYLYGKHEWYRKWMIVRALLHIAGETIKIYPRMARREGWLRNPVKAVVKLAFGAEMLLRLLWSALPVFRASYHPRRHPVATTRQDPIQIAWRRHAAAGGDVLAIDHARMAEIMGVAPEA